MSEIAKIQRNFQITLPAPIRREANVHVGDLVEVEVREDGVLLRPVTTVDRKQAWFWSKRWQEKEKKVEADFKKVASKFPKASASSSMSWINDRCPLAPVRSGL